MTAVERHVVNEAGIPVGRWVVNPYRSRVVFELRHLSVRTVRGEVAIRSGEVLVARETLSSSACGVLDMTTFDTGDRIRDEFLRSDSFFVTNTFPTMTYESRQVTPRGPHWSVSGDLTVRDNTAPVELLVTWSALSRNADGRLCGRISARGELNRREHGVVVGGRLADSAAVLGAVVRLALDVQVVLE